MSEIETALDFVDDHFLKIVLSITLVCITLFGVSCYSFNQALQAYNEKSKVETKVEESK